MYSNGTLNEEQGMSHKYSLPIICVGTFNLKCFHVHWALMPFECFEKKIDNFTYNVTSLL